MDTKKYPGAKLEEGEALRARGQLGPAWAVLASAGQTDSLCVEARTNLFSPLSWGPRAATARHGPVGEGRPLSLSWVWAYLEEEHFSLGATALGPGSKDGGNTEARRLGLAPPA